MRLTNSELETTARTCRALAFQERERAKGVDHPGDAQPIERTANRAAALAEKFEQTRKGAARSRARTS
jgi:hypothetical protein